MRLARAGKIETRVVDWPKRNGRVFDWLRRSDVPGRGKKGKGGV